MTLTFTRRQQFEVKHDEVTVRRSDDQERVLCYHNSAKTGADLQQISKFLPAILIIAYNQLQHGQVFRCNK